MEVCSLTGHSDNRVWHVAWSPSGKALASCGADKASDGAAPNATATLAAAGAVNPNACDRLTPNFSSCGFFSGAVLLGLVRTRPPADARLGAEPPAPHAPPHVQALRIWVPASDGTDGWVCSAMLEDAQSRTVRRCEWSPCGHFLAAASFDATTVIWEWRSDDPEGAAGSSPFELHSTHTAAHTPPTLRVRVVRSGVSCRAGALPWHEEG